MMKHSIPLLATLALLLGGVGTAKAGTIYVTSLTGVIDSVDTTTGAVTQVVNVGVPVDSLFFDPSGRILFSAVFAGRYVARYDPNTQTTVTLATGFREPADLALTPNGKSFYVS